MRKPKQITAKKKGGGGDARSQMLRYIMPHLSGERSKRLEVSIQNNDGQSFRTYWDMVGTTIEEKLNEQRKNLGNPNNRVTAKAQSIAQMKADLARAEALDCSKMPPAAAKKLKEFKQMMRDSIQAMEMVKSSKIKVLASDPIKVKIEKYKAIIESLQHRIKETMLAMKDAVAAKRAKLQERIKEMKQNIEEYKKKIQDAATKFRKEFQQGLKGKATASYKTRRSPTLPVKAHKLKVIYA